jgi:hypothetical protein
VSGTVRKSNQFLTVISVIWLGCAAPVAARAQAAPKSNWTTADVPCARYDDLRKPVLGNIGVRIDAMEPWADEFRRALRFWNTVLTVNFYEDTSLDSCAVRIIEAGPDILNHASVARSQLTEWDTFRGKIAVSPAAAKEMSSGEMYGTAVHELGHMLGLKHNQSTQSVMYFLNVNGTEVLDKSDMLDLSACHKLRMAVLPTSLPITAVLTVLPIAKP